MSSIGIIFAFIISIFKPIRKRFIIWIMKYSNTKQWEDHFITVDSSIEGIRDNILKLSEQIDEHIKQNSTDSIVSTNILRLLLRCQMRNIYMNNYENKTLTVREQRDVQDYYSLYKDLGGNNYVDAMVEEMIDWHLQMGL